MSDLRKALEELAEKWEAQAAKFGDGWVGDDLRLASRRLREALAANPEPEPEWEWGIGFFEEGHGVQVHVSEESARHELPRHILNNLFKRSAPGQWIKVNDDE